MNYTSYQVVELMRAGIQEGELAIYTGTVSPNQTHSIGRNTQRRNAYVYVWEDGQPVERDAQFQNDRAGLDVLDVQAGEGNYAFLRDRPSGYIRQIAGPAAPIVMANFGAIPLRVDTFLGKFTVPAGTMLRLDENAPQREKKRVLLTVGAQDDPLLKSAEVWDGTGWRRLNIRREPYTIGEGQGFIVLDGAAIVQQAAVHYERQILLMDAPESDPDYEIYVTAQGWGMVTLSFDRRDYKGGRVVQRTRTICSTSWGERVVYNLQKLKETRTEAEANLCRIELSELPGPPAGAEPQPMESGTLDEFLDAEDEPVEEPVVLPEPDEYEANEAEPEGSAIDSLLAALEGSQQGPQAAPVPEPPEGFPE